MARPSGIRWGFLAFAVLLLVCNGYFTFAIARSYRQQVRAHEVFLPVPATVLDSGVQRIDDPDGADSFHLAVRYTYEVNGQRYESDTVAFLGEGYNDYSEAREAAARYPVGGTVTAYYDPAAPEVAVLDNSLPRTLPFLAAALGVFWAGWVAVLRYALWPVLRGWLNG